MADDGSAQSATVWPIPKFRFEVKWDSDVMSFQEVSGLDIEADLAGTQHFGGRANQNPDGSYYLMGMDGYIWTDGGVGTGGYTWTDGYVWTDGYIWTDAYLWTDGTLGANGHIWTDGYVWTDGYIWTDGYVWTDGYLWTDSLAEPMSINSWVPQE